MSIPNDSKFWLQFFAKAGIPRSTAMEYAITFSDNRIDSNMLNDLTKEYLKEMNITLIGDVIAILKHAGEVAKADYFTRKTPTTLTNDSAKRNGAHATLNFVVNRAPPLPTAAPPNRGAATPNRIQQTPAAVNAGKSANTAQHAQLPPDAGAYTVHIPPGARRKLAEAERRRLAATSGERSQQQPAAVSGLQNGLQNLRVVRTASGVRLVSGRPQPSRQPTAAPRLAVRGAYMDNPRVNDRLAMNRLGKRRTANGHGNVGTNGPQTGVSFNVLVGVGAAPKRRKLSNGEPTALQRVAPQSARERVGPRTGLSGRANDSVATARSNALGQRVVSAPANYYAYSGANTSRTMADTTRLRNSQPPRRGARGGSVDLRSRLHRRT